MRDPADVARIERFMKALGRHARGPARVYLTGGATAVLHGWRRSTIDIDVKFVPESDELLRAVRELKDDLSVNVELASPADFIPVRSDWEERSPFICREGRVFFHHFDLLAQVLSKIERDHAQDREDVQHFLQSGLVSRHEVLAYFEAIAPHLYRYPSLDERAFRAKVERVTGSEQER